MEPRLILGSGKSKKDFKPKAPVRRPAAPSSGPPSLHDSTELQVISQRQTPPLESAEHSSSRNEPRLATSGGVSTDTAAPPTSTSPARKSPQGPSQIYSLATTKHDVSSDSAGAHSLAVSNPPLPKKDAVGPKPNPAVSQNDRASKTLTSAHSRNRDSSRAKTRSSSNAPPTSQIKELSDATSKSTAGAIEPRPKRRKVGPTQPEQPEQIGTPSITSKAARNVNKSPTFEGLQAEPTRPSSQDEGGPFSLFSKKRKAAESVEENADIADARKCKKIARLQKKVASSGDQGNRESRPASQKTANKKRKRAKTPPNAESAKIAPNDVQMADLCRDNHAGKKSTREARLEEHERDQKAAEARELLRELMGEGNGAPNEEPSEAASAKPRKSRLEQRAKSPEIDLLAPRVRVVNGQIVQDDSSRVVDRHAAAAHGRDDSDVEEREEDELTRRVNSASYMKRLPSLRWTADMTEQFYEGLRLFGTDFMMMATLFPGFTRRQLKLKFSKEERLNEAIIKQLLLHERKTPDLAELQRLANVTYRDPAEVERELEEDRKRLEEEARIEREAQEQLERERQEQVDREALRDGGEGGWNAKDGERSESTGKSKQKKEANVGQAGEAIVEENPQDDEAIEAVQRRRSVRGKSQISDKTPAPRRTRRGVTTSAT